MSHSFDSPAPSATPNVVVQTPTVRFVANIILGVVGLIVGTATVVDAASPAFDISAITIPVTVGYAYLAGIFGLAVTTPNVPR